MRIHELKPASGSNTKAKRVGRGIGSGSGKTASKGQKGQKSRSGGVKGPHFEGGQTPLQRRLPKRGFTNVFQKVYNEINIDELNRFEPGTVVTPKLLRESGLVKKINDGVKILGNGDLQHALTIQAQAFSKSAAAKIEKAGGKVEVI